MRKRVALVVTLVVVGSMAICVPILVGMTSSESMSITGRVGMSIMFVGGIAILYFGDHIVNRLAPLPREELERQNS